MNGLSARQIVDECGMVPHWNRLSAARMLAYTQSGEMLNLYVGFIHDELQVLFRDKIPALTEYDVSAVRTTQKAQDAEAYLGYFYGQDAVRIAVGDYAHDLALQIWCLLRDVDEEELPGLMLDGPRAPTVRKEISRIAREVAFELNIEA